MYSIDNLTIMFDNMISTYFSCQNDGIKNISCINVFFLNTTTYHMSWTDLFLYAHSRKLIRREFIYISISECDQYKSSYIKNDKF